MIKGIVVKSAAQSYEDSYGFEHMAISLFPTPFPVSHYTKAKDIQPHLGKLLAYMVKEPSRIHKVLEHFDKTDPFLNKLIKISKRYQSLSKEAR